MKKFAEKVFLKTHKILDGNYVRAVEEKKQVLQKKFDDFVRITDEKKLTIVKELLDQVGTIDAEVEGLSTTENQRDLSIKFRWGHNHRFNDDLSISGQMTDRHIKLMAEFMVRNKLPLDHFEGKSVVDVGCWTGGTLLLLKALGAEKVLALEEVQKYAKTASRLAHDVYELEGVTCEGTNLYSLETEMKYDIIYFPGVIYHLSDPVVALRRLFNACKDGGEIFVESAGLHSSKPISAYDGNRVYYSGSKENMNRGGWNWFLPSSSCLDRWMLEAGFEEMDCYYSYASYRVFGYGKRKKHVEITRAGLSVPDMI